MAIKEKLTRKQVNKEELPGFIDFTNAIQQARINAEKMISRSSRTPQHDQKRISKEGNLQEIAEIRNYVEKEVMEKFNSPESLNFAFADGPKKSRSA